MMAASSSMCLPSWHAHGRRRLDLSRACEALFMGLAEACEHAGPASTGAQRRLALLLAAVRGEIDDPTPAPSAARAFRASLSEALGPPSHAYAQLRTTEPPSHPLAMEGPEPLSGFDEFGTSPPKGPLREADRGLDPTSPLRYAHEEDEEGARAAPATRGREAPHASGGRGRARGRATRRGGLTWTRGGVAAAWRSCSRAAPPRTRPTRSPRRAPPAPRPRTPRPRLTAAAAQAGRRARRRGVAGRRGGGGGGAGAGAGLAAREAVRRLEEHELRLLKAAARLQAAVHRAADAHDAHRAAAAAAVRRLRAACEDALLPLAREYAGLLLRRCELATALLLEAARRVDRRLALAHEAVRPGPPRPPPASRPPPHPAPADHGGGRPGAVRAAARGGGVGVVRGRGFLEAGAGGGVPGGGGASLTLLAELADAESLLADLRPPPPSFARPPPAPAPRPPRALRAPAGPAGPAPAPAPSFFARLAGRGASPPLRGAPQRTPRPPPPPPPRGTARGRPAGALPAPSSSSSSDDDGADFDAACALRSPARPRAPGGAAAGARARGAPSAAERAEALRALLAEARAAASAPVRASTAAGAGGSAGQGGRWRRRGSGWRGARRPRRPARIADELAAEAAREARALAGRRRGRGAEAEAGALLGPLAGRLLFGALLRPLREATRRPDADAGTGRGEGRCGAGAWRSWGWRRGGAGALRGGPARGLPRPRGPRPLLRPRDAAARLEAAARALRRAAGAEGPAGAPAWLPADAFLPLFVYALLHSALAEPHAALALLTAFASEAERLSEAGYYAATLEAALLFVERAPAAPHPALRPAGRPPDPPSAPRPPTPPPAASFE
eukprot:tig00001729_g9736.t1